VIFNVVLIIALVAGYVWQSWKITKVSWWIWHESTYGFETI